MQILSRLWSFVAARPVRFRRVVRHVLPDRGVLTVLVLASIQTVPGDGRFDALRSANRASSAACFNAKTKRQQRVAVSLRSESSRARLPLVWRWAFARGSFTARWRRRRAPRRFRRPTFQTPFSNGARRGGF